MSHSYDTIGMQTWVLFHFVMMIRPNELFFSNFRDIMIAHTAYTSRGNQMSGENIFETDNGVFMRDIGSDSV